MLHNMEAKNIFVPPGSGITENNSDLDQKYYFEFAAYKDGSIHYCHDKFAGLLPGIYSLREAQDILRRANAAGGKDRWVILRQDLR